MRWEDPVSLTTFPGRKDRVLLSTLVWYLEGPRRGPYLTAPAGLLTDGGSIPKMLYPIVGCPLAALELPGYVFHDALYRVPELRQFSAPPNKAIVYNTYGIRDAKLDVHYKPDKHFKQMPETSDGIRWTKTSRRFEMTRAGADLLLLHLLRAQELYISKLKKPQYSISHRAIHLGVRLGGWHSWRKKATSPLPLIPQTELKRILDSLGSFGEVREKRR